MNLNYHVVEVSMNSKIECVLTLQKKVLIVTDVLFMWIMIQMVLKQAVIQMIGSFSYKAVTAQKRQSVFQLTLVHLR